MWLSPPARAGIVKLSGAGKDAQTALRDALSLSPLQEHRSGRNRGWEASTIFTKVPVCVYMWLCVHVRMCELMLCWHYFSAVPHCCCCWCYRSKWAPLLPQKPVFKVRMLLTAHLWAYNYLMHYALVCEAILSESLVRVHICVCLWENKNHCLVRLRNIPLPLLSTDESIAPGSYRQTLCWLLIYEFVQYDNNNMSFSVVGSWCVCLILSISGVCLFSNARATAVKYNRECIWAAALHWKLEVFSVRCSFSCTTTYIWIHHSRLKAIQDSHLT